MKLIRAAKTVVVNFADCQADCRNYCASDSKCSGQCRDYGTDCRTH